MVLGSVAGKGLSSCHRLVKKEANWKILDEFGLGLRRDVPNSESKQQEAWRGLKLVGSDGLVN